MQHFVIIPTVGRAALLENVLAHLVERLPPSWSVIVNGATQTDWPQISSAQNERVQLMTGPRGLAAQRNSALKALPENAEIVVFLDDDFLVSDDYFTVIERIFATHSDVVGINVALAADGAGNAGFTFAQGVELLHRRQQRKTSYTNMMPLQFLYGCNMAIRRSAIRAMPSAEQTFDERLPLYAWLEDRDFAKRLLKAGRIVYTNETFGVHLGVKTGKTSGLQYGYSQMVNPVYLLRKGTLSVAECIALMLKPLVKNAVMVFREEATIDRRGRLKGNFRGLRDIALKRDDPEHIKGF